MRAVVLLSIALFMLLTFFAQAEAKLVAPGPSAGTTVEAARTNTSLKSNASGGIFEQQPADLRAIPQRGHDCSPFSGNQNIAALFEAKTIHDTRIHYFSMLAELAAVMAALLLTFAMVRLEMLGRKLEIIQNSIGEVFWRAAKDVDYRNQTEEYMIEDRWEEYFDAVEALTQSYPDRFLDGQHYSELGRQVQVQIDRGRKVAHRVYPLSLLIRFTLLAAVAVVVIAITGLMKGSPGTTVLGDPIWIVSTAMFVAFLGLYVITALERQLPEWLKRHLNRRRPDR